MRMDLVQPQPSSNAVRKCEHIGHQLLCACLRFDDLAHPLTLRKTHGPLRGNPRLTVTQQVRWQAGRQQMGMGENEHPPKKTTRNVLLHFISEKSQNDCEFCGPSGTSILTGVSEMGYAPNNCCLIGK